MDDLDFTLSFETHPNDFPEDERLWDVVIKGLVAYERIIEWKVSDWLKRNHSSDLPKISVRFISEKSHEWHLQRMAVSARRFPLSYELGVSVSEDEKKVSVTTLFDANDFRFLEAADLLSSPGVKFSIPVIEVGMLPKEWQSKTEKFILDFISSRTVESLRENGLELVSEILRKALSSIEPLEVKREIGSAVQNPFDEGMSVTLVSHWIPDYVNHYAKIVSGDETEMVHFMIYWRMFSWRFATAPWGHLSWKAKDILSYNPNESGSPELLFKIGRGNVDFSYFNDPPRKRSSGYHDGFPDFINATYSPQSVRLNYGTGFS